MNTWKEAIGHEKQQPYFQHILQQVQQAAYKAVEQFIHLKKKYLVPLD